MNRGYGAYRGAREHLAGEGRNSPKAPRKALKALFLAVLVVVFLSLWVVLALRGNLAEMAIEQARELELRQQHQELSKQRDQLLAAERIKTEAAKLGLFPPGEDQVRHF